jgi:hypothetical protein
LLFQPFTNAPGAWAWLELQEGFHEVVRHRNTKGSCTPALPARPRIPGDAHRALAAKVTQTCQLMARVRSPVISGLPALISRFHTN